MGETNGRRGIWAYARGGMGSVSAALAAAAQSYGTEIRCAARVVKIRTTAGRANGVILEDGTEFSARTVVSNADPQATLLGLLDQTLLPDDVRVQTANLDFRSPVLKINVALDRLPEFKCRPAACAELQGTIHIGATCMSALEESFAAAQMGRLPQQPVIEMTIPSIIDDSIAPPGTRGEWLPDARAGAVPVWRRHAPGRRRHGCLRAQCGQCDLARPWRGVTDEQIS